MNRHPKFIQPGRPKAAHASTTVQAKTGPCYIDPYSQNAFMRYDHKIPCNNCYVKLPCNFADNNDQFQLICPNLRCS